MLNLRIDAAFGRQKEVGGWTAFRWANPQFEGYFFWYKLGPKRRAPFGAV